MPPEPRGQTAAWAKSLGCLILLVLRDGTFYESRTPTVTLAA